MKPRVVLPLAALLLTGIVIGVILYWNSQGPSALKASKGATLHKWLTAYALDNGGAFPRDLNDLTKKSYGANKDYFPNVIEYRGAGLTTADNPSLLLLRYRVDDHSDLEGRVYLSGAGAVRHAKDF